MTPASAKPPRRLLYFANEDFAFLLKRLPMARAAREAGFEVHVATRLSRGRRRSRPTASSLRQVQSWRGGLSPFAAIPTIFALRNVGSGEQ